MKFALLILYVTLSLAAQIATAAGAGVGLCHLVGSGWWWCLWIPMLAIHGFAFQTNRDQVAHWLMK